MHFADQGRLTEIERIKAFERIVEKDFFPFTKMATVVCDAPIAFISILDHLEEHFLVRIGLDRLKLAKDISICGHAIQQENVYIIHDIPSDSRFLHYPRAMRLPDLKFYAGAPLTTSKNIKVGMICVLDFIARTLSKDQETSLKIMASHVISKLEDELMKDKLNLAVGRLKTLINSRWREIKC